MQKYNLCVLSNVRIVSTHVPCRGKYYMTAYIPGRESRSILCTCMSHKSQMAEAARVTTDRWRLLWNNATLLQSVLSVDHRAPPSGRVLHYCPLTTEGNVPPHANWDAALSKLTQRDVDLVADPIMNPNSLKMQNAIGLNHMSPLNELKPQPFTYLIN